VTCLTARAVGIYTQQTIKTFKICLINRENKKTITLSPLSAQEYQKSLASWNQSLLCKKF